MLFNGIVSQRDDFNIASEKLDNGCFDLIQRFYQLLDSRKVKTPNNVKLYEEFLSKPPNELTRKFNFYFS
jgi:hypothetical protein